MPSEGVGRAEGLADGEALVSLLREAVPEYNPHPDAMEAFEAAGQQQRGGSDT